MNEKSPPIKLLLIEDSPSDAALLRQYLTEIEDVTFEVQHSSTLQQGIHAVCVETYDAIILDLGLPDSSGLRTFEKLRQRIPATPIIILTGREDRNLSMEALKLGADSYLVKDSATAGRIAICILTAMRNRAMGVNYFNAASDKHSK